MKYDTAGTYELTYKAVDDCGNETTETRVIVVENIEQYRTVLYADGHFIINESPADIERNTALHGTATNIYPPYDAENDYIFPNITDRPWHNEREQVKSAEIGSAISPTSLRYWFTTFNQCTEIDLTNLDTSNVTDMSRVFNVCTILPALDLSGFDTSKATTMEGMFNGCQGLSEMDLTNFDTSKVTDMSYMFQNMNCTNFNLSSFDTSNCENMNRMFMFCRQVETLDLSNFDTSKVADMYLMFNGCEELTTIYASSLFTTTSVTSGSSVFQTCPKLVGGAGTVWNRQRISSEYARIDNPPDALGYFTEK